VVDLDSDGRLDILSGSYWPGEIWLFRGKGGGAFEKGGAIDDAGGGKLHAGPPWKDKENPEMDSLAAAPFAYDHDGDGDLDLLVGNIRGRVILIRNEGSREKPAFGKSKTPIEAGGAAIEVPGGDAGPTIADWDSDGKPDLIVGAGDGSVFWYRNKGSKTSPAYEKGVALVKGGGYEGLSEAPLEGSTPQGPGMRTKPCVTDFDGDGDQDLLVGDYMSFRKPAPVLTDAQTKRRDELRKERDAAIDKLQGWGNVKKPEDPEVQAVQKKFGEILQELSPLEDGHQPHGFVWLYRRASKAPPGTEF